MAAAVVTVIVEDILLSLEEGMKLGQQWGIEYEIIEIRDLLSSVRGVLPEVEDKHGRSLELQKWVQNLKHAAFDVEDLLEELSVEDALWQHETKVRRLVRAIHRFKFWWRIRGELRDVTRQLQNLIRSDWVGLLRNIPDEIGETHEAPVAVPLIGRNRQKVELVSLLLDRGRERERDFPILVLHGAGGIGKTAHVQKVLSESEVSGHFNYIIWVNASPPFDESKMAQDIIASLTNAVAIEEENVVKEQLLLRVRKLLDGGKKYLFILDDLSFQNSEIQRWLGFKRFLLGGPTGSTILVTAQDLHWIYDGDSHNVTLPSLTKEESRELLLTTAFKGGVKQITDPAKHQIAEEVAAKCDGKPLLIRAAGDYLSLQHDTSDWSSLQNFHSVLPSLLYGGYPYGHLSPMVMRYNHLPPRMKQSFGLCSLFPRGHAMNRQTLAELWIALGYIKSSNRRSLEDIADDYFNQLLMEELFRVKKFNTFGKVTSVVLHPNVEDLALSVAGWECNAFRWSDFPFKKDLQKVRHLSFIEHENLYQCPCDFRKLRTILYFEDDCNTAEILCNHFIPLLSRGLARVLDVHHMNVEVVPEAVWKLMHLRYLNLSDNRRITSLPLEITGLLNLQTLKLSGCWALKELPPDMQKMVSLRHLYIDGCWKLCLMPKGLGDLKFLNILTDFILPPADSSSVDSANLADLCKLNDLRGSLRIPNLCNSEAAGETFEIQGLLDKKSSLESLELIFMNLPTDSSLLDKLRPHSNLKGLRIHNYGATLFPEWMAYLTNLVEIALIGCENCEYLPQFGQLRHLKSLTIQGLPDLLRMESGSELSSRDAANNTQPFGELSSLCIRDCPKLESLPRIPHLAKLTLVNVSEQLFRHPFCIASSLKTLRLENIELLDYLPEEWLRDLTCLEELHIGSCPSLVSLSRGMMHLKNLESLSIWNCKELDLSKDEYGEVMMELGLKSLKSLTIYKALKMEQLPVWLLRVYTLRSLFIRSCLYLVDLPDWIGMLESLELIELVHCPQLTYLPDAMYEFSSDYQRKLSIIGCPLLMSDGFKHPHWL